MQGLYVVYDRVAQEGSPVMQCVNDGIATRAYRGLLQQVAKVDMDAYKLLKVGELDPVSLQGKIYDVPVEVIAPITQLDLITEDTNGKA